MEKASKNTSSSKEQSENNNLQFKKDSIIENNLLENPKITEKNNSAKQTMIKFSQPIKHFSRLQDVISIKETSSSNLKLPFMVNNENAFGYRILFEAFYENLDKKTTFALGEKDNIGLCLGE